MLPTKICFIGLHILIIFHVAHSFVLLTANMDDLKRLARKFVSDQFAEKIVELIAKATSGLLTPAPNMSEENEANVDDIQKVSDNEVMDPYKGPKLGLRTTSSRYAQDSREVVKPKQIKVNSQYAVSDLRSQELTELSEYRNPLKLPIVKPQYDLPERNVQKPLNFLQQIPQPQNLDGGKENIKLYNIEQKRPKISYHKSKVPDKNINIDAQYATVNVVGGENREINNFPAVDDRYYPASEQIADKDRNPKILDLKYQSKKDIHQDNFGKVEAKDVKIKESIKKDKKRKAKSEEYLDKVKKLAEKDRVDKYIKKDKKIKAKSEEYLDKVKNLAEKDREDKYYNNKKKIGKFDEKSKAMELINFDPQIRSETAKNNTLHMFVQKGGQLEEVTTVTTKQVKMGFDQYQPRSKLKHAPRSRKNKHKSRKE